MRLHKHEKKTAKVNKTHGGPDLAMTIFSCLQQFVSVQHFIALNILQSNGRATSIVANTLRPHQTPDTSVFQTHM